MSVVIKIDEDLQDELARLGTVKDTYNTVIWKLLNAYKEQLKDGKCPEHGRQPLGKVDQSGEVKS